MMTHRILGQTQSRFLSHWILALVLGGMLGTMACAGDSSKTVTLTEKDDSTTVQLTTGDRVVVRLSVSAGTGYSWQLDREEAELLPLDGKPRLESPPEAKPGAPETQIFHFLAKNQGEVPLAFRLVRPWEKDARPARTYSVTVRIH